MIRRPPRSTPLYSSAASDVYKRQGVRRAGQAKAIVALDGSRQRRPILGLWAQGRSRSQYDFLLTGIVGDGGRYCTAAGCPFKLERGTAHGGRIHVLVKDSTHRGA